MVQVGNVQIGQGFPLVLIAGLNVIETEQATVDCAAALKALAARSSMPLIFKASFDKANRSKYKAFRGPLIDRGLEILARVKNEVGVPLLTDVHEPHQAERVATVVDCLQIPAFLSRQTDLIEACAMTGLPLNLKKAQFMSPADMLRAVEKATLLGAAGVIATERGTLFGYNDLVVDMRGLLALRSSVPVCLDATHASQYPGKATGGSSGDSTFVAPLARAGVAVGVDAVFLEVHPDPPNAPCDGACQIRFEELERLVDELRAIRDVVGGKP